MGGRWRSSSGAGTSHRGEQARTLPGAPAENTRVALRSAKVEAGVGAALGGSGVGARVGTCKGAARQPLFRLCVVQHVAVMRGANATPSVEYDDHDPPGNPHGELACPAPSALSRIVSPLSWRKMSLAELTTHTRFFALKYSSACSPGRAQRFAGSTPLQCGASSQYMPLAPAAPLTGV